MAMMMARLYTGAHDIITLRNAYHGLSGGPAPVAAWVCSTAYRHAVSFACCN
jgi:4-aminobutyrate aminotransferase-like enzyme